MVGCLPRTGSRSVLGAASALPSFPLHLLFFSLPYCFIFLSLVFTCFPTSFLLPFLFFSLMILTHEDTKCPCTFPLAHVQHPLPPHVSVSLPLSPLLFSLPFPAALSGLGGEGWATQAGSGPQEGTGLLGKAFHARRGSGPRNVSISRQILKAHVVSAWAAVVLPPPPSLRW